MKNLKATLAVILLLLSNSAFAQNFSLADLIRLNKMSIDTFEVEMKDKYKFTFAEKRMPPAHTYAYCAYELQKDGKTLTIEKIVNTDKKPNSITYNTIYNADLDNIRAQLLKEGYKVKETRKTFGNAVIITDYVLNDMEAQLVIPIAGNGLRYGITVRSLVVN